MATIGINALFLLPNKVGGTEYHLRNVIAAWQKEDTRTSYIIYANKENAKTFGVIPRNWTIYECPLSASNKIARVLFEQLLFPFLLLQQGVEEIRSFGYLGPILFPKKKWVTVHDANWKDCPEDFSFVERLVLGVLIECSLFTANTVMTDSHFSKERLIHHFPWLKRKIQVLSPILSEQFVQEAKKKHKHPLNGKKYVLTVSGFYPHKKIPYALELMDKILRENENLSYVLIGNNGKETTKVLQLMQANDRIIHHPKVTLPELVAMYQHTSLFLFPSVYEGFGYPVYEAVHCGVPLVVGNKQLYSDEISKKSDSLAFDIETDATNIHKSFLI